MARIGNWEIDEQLGEGAFGRTFRGHHYMLLDVPVCIKQEKTGVPAYMDLFRQEAQILSRLRSSYLPTFIDYDELPDFGQVIMLSFIKGPSLEKLVKATNDPNGTPLATDPLDDEHILWIADRICCALSYLHGKHTIVHCDLKPANVILEVEDHVATVVDLGMAAFRPDEHAKAKGGTAGYIPPEANLGMPPIPAFDIYSLGSTMLFLAGGNPYKGIYPLDMQPKLRALIESMTRHDPRQRPQSADFLRNDIGRMRKEIYGRTSTKESLKFRDGRLEK